MICAGKLSGSCQFNLAHKLKKTKTVLVGTEMRNMEQVLHVNKRSEPMLVRSV